MNPNTNQHTPTPKENLNPAPKKSAYENTDRDEGTTGTTRERNPSNAGFADQDQPPWSPPESQPEPRPVDPILNPSKS